jgi:hypothetical protein
MQALKIRPTFEILLPVNRITAVEKIRKEIENLERKDLNRLFGNYGELYLPPAECRLWSPFLAFHVDELGEESLVNGRFAPRLEVWTFVWVVYLAMAFSVFFGLVVGYVQWFIGEPVWGLAVAGFGVLVIAVLHIVASVGQQCSADQMTVLRTRLEAILKGTEDSTEP